MTNELRRGCTRLSQVTPTFIESGAPSGNTEELRLQLRVVFQGLQAECFDLPTPRAMHDALSIASRENRNAYFVSPRNVTLSGGNEAMVCTRLLSPEVASARVRPAHILGGWSGSTTRFPKNLWEIVKIHDFSSLFMDFQ